MSRHIDASELLLEIQACNWGNEQDKDRVEDLVLGMPTIIPQNEWISVDYAVPDPGDRVLATDGIFVGEAYRTSANSWYRHTGFPWRLACEKIVSHWMPLPGLSDKDNNVPTKEQNEPLTIEQLREMDGEPVYVVPANEYSELGKWCVISIGDSDDYSCAIVPGVEYWSWKFDSYGEQWLAYRRPPERQEDT